MAKKKATAANANNNNNTNVNTNNEQQQPQQQDVGVLDRFLKEYVENPQIIFRAQFSNSTSSSGNSRSSIKDKDDDPLRKQLDNDVKAVAKLLFKQTSNGVIEEQKRFGPLTELLTDGFDEEQIWEEMVLMNKPLLGYLEKRVHEFNEMPIDQDEDQMEEKDTEEDEEEEEGFEFDEDDEEENMMEENEEGDDDEMEEEEEDEEEDEEGKSSSKKGKAAATKKRHEVEDDFFSLKEMEEFVADAEREAMKGSDEEEDEEDDDLDDDEDMELDEGDEEELEDLDEDKDMRKSLKKRKVKFSGENEEFEFEKDDSNDDDDEFDEEEFDEEGDANEFGEEYDDDDDEEKPRKKRLLDDSDDEDDGLSKYEKRIASLNETIQQLEEESLAEQHWSLKGEASGRDRPKDSLLEEDLEFDRATKIVPVITEDITLSLEDLIKRRILDRAFDDVERKVPTEAPEAKPKELPEISQEKSSKSLGEIYEDEYLKQKRGEGNEEKTELDKQHAEITKEFRDLCVRLDALSNFYFTPKPVQEEIEIIPNVPALALEEVIPDHVADTSLLAPEEIYDKRTGVVTGETEKTAADKRRQRLEKKKRKQKAKKLKEKNEKLVDKINPGLGNKHSKEKALKELMASGADVTIVNHKTGKKMESLKKKLKTPPAKVSNPGALKL